MAPEVFCSCGLIYAGLMCTFSPGDSARLHNFFSASREEMCCRYQSPAAAERMVPSPINLNESIYPGGMRSTAPGDSVRLVILICRQELAQNKEVTSRTESTGAIELMGPRQINPHSPRMWGAVKSPCQIALYLPLERRPRAI